MISPQTPQGPGIEARSEFKDTGRPIGTNRCLGKRPSDFAPIERWGGKGRRSWRNFYFLFFSCLGTE
jgi:hypothetical protein